MIFLILIARKNIFGLPSSSGYVATKVSFELLYRELKVYERECEYFPSKLEIEKIIDRNFKDLECSKFIPVVKSIPYFRDQWGNKFLVKSKRLLASMGQDAKIDTYDDIYFSLDSKSLNRFSYSQDLSFIDKIKLNLKNVRELF